MILIFDIDLHLQMTQKNNAYPTCSYFTIKLTQQFYLCAKLSSSPQSQDILDLYLLGSSTLQFYFHSKLTSVPFSLSLHFQSVLDLYDFMKCHCLQQMNVLWPKNNSSEAMIRLLIKNRQFSFGIPRVLKKRTALEQLQNKRKLSQLKLTKNQIQNLNKIANKYRQVQQILKKTKISIFKASPIDEREELGGKRNPPADSFKQHYQGTKKFIIPSSQFHISHSPQQLKRKNKQVNVSPTTKENEESKPELLDKMMNSNLKKVIQNGVIEYNKERQRNRYFWSPLLTAITLPIIPEPFPVSDLQDQLIPPNFKNSIFRNKYHIKIEKDHQVVTRLPSSDRNFYHLHHHKPISNNTECIVVTLANIPHQDFTVGILGRNALTQSRKEWPNQIVAYVGCANVLVSGIQQKSAFAKFQPGDQICVKVDLSEKRIKFAYNRQRFCQTSLPIWIPDEYYFFFQTSTSGTKVLFSFHQFQI